MNNLLHYIQQYGSMTFEQKVVNDVDILLFTELGYLTYDGIVPTTFDFSEGITIHDIWQKTEEKSRDLLETNPFMITPERMELLQTVGESNRFGSVKVFGFVNDIDPEVTKQFAVMIFQWREDQRLIVFRGTDETLIGWKEDFMMTYASEVPSQVDATNYLKQQLETYPGTLIVTGHSKGGNLALYASAMQEKELQEKIDRIYCFEAPGVHRSVLNSEGYQRIVSKAIRYIPQESVVGVMLLSDVPYVIIQSHATKMADQHSAMTWTIEDDHFVEIDALTRNSIWMDRTFKNWTANVLDEDLALFWECFFDMLFSLGMETVNDVDHGFMYYLQKFIERANHMETKQRDTLIRVGLSLLQQRYVAWREITNFSVEMPSMEDILKTLKISSPNIEIAYDETDDNELIRHYYQQRHQQKKLEEKSRVKNPK